MGKRKQPFGYKMKLGEIVPQPQEAEAVRSIYLQYLAGASFKQLAEQLQTEDVPYDEDKSWNKNMVARILEDDRYIGEKEFPALIPTEQFHAAQERRKEMRPEYKQTPAQKELRKLCGGTVPDSVARKVLKILNQMVDDPQIIKIETSGVPTTEESWRVSKRRNMNHTGSAASLVRRQSCGSWTQTSCGRASEKSPMTVRQSKSC